MKMKAWEALLSLVVLFVFMNFSDFNPLLAWDAYADALYSVFHWLNPAVSFLLLLASWTTGQILVLRADRRKECASIPA